MTVMNATGRPSGAAEPHGEEAKDHKVEIRDRREVRRTRERDEREVFSDKRDEKKEERVVQTIRRDIGTMGCVPNTT